MKKVKQSAYKILEEHKKSFIKLSDKENNIKTTEIYRPLPLNLTIKNSTIDGLGLFATENIPPNYEFGISHVYDGEFNCGYIRTPLGGFFNHSETPNCEAYIDGRFIKLKSIVGIKASEEITVKYWLYEVKSDT